MVCKNELANINAFKCAVLGLIKANTFLSAQVPIRTLSRLEDKYKEISAESARRAWQEWLGAAIKGNARGAHAYIRQAVAPQLELQAGQVSHPQRTIQHHADKWGEVWRNDSQEEWLRA